MSSLTPTNKKTYAVHDHWTDINTKNDVDIISIDGEITRIKVNGEDYGGGGGSSDFSTARVTLTNPPQSGTVDFEQSVYIAGDYMVGGVGGFSAEAPLMIFVLYKGEGFAHFPPQHNFTVTGNIEYDQELGDLLIRGDGTITIS